jgi:hypothetical protein
MGDPSAYKPTLHAPVIMVAMALPAFKSFVKYRRRFGVIIVIIFIVLGIFSAGLYSTVTKSSEAESRYIDLSHILNILLNFENEEVFTPSYRNYRTRRAAAMANFDLTEDPTCRLYLIDVEYTDEKLIDSLRNDMSNNVLYQGDAFILLETIN